MISQIQIERFVGRDTVQHAYVRLRFANQANRYADVRNGSKSMFWGRFQQ
jgi:hypothetical protein